ncbi:MAG: EamA family transporter [Bacteroidales bacterium]|nr:EamA family transporter [Bacteroidales bacterium]
MWIPFVIMSAIFLGVYDICKKTSLKENAVLVVMLISSAVSLLLMTPMIVDSAFGTGFLNGTIFETPQTTMRNQLWIILKAFIVQSSWLCNFYAMKHLPISIVGPVRSSAPAWTLFGAVVILGERLNIYQWIGAIIILICLFLYANYGRKEGIRIKHNKFVYFLVLGTLIGSMSALYDKVILRSLEINRNEVQSWFSFYQFIIALILMLVVWYPNREKTDKFKFRFTIPLIGLFLTIADFLYFYGLSQDGVLIGIVSLIRRSNVIISFTAGALLFHEKNIKQKAVILFVILIGIAMLCLLK